MPLSHVESSPRTSRLVPGSACPDSSGRRQDFDSRDFASGCIAVRLEIDERSVGLSASEPIPRYFQGARHAPVSKLHDIYQRWASAHEDVEEGKDCNILHERFQQQKP